MVSSLVSPQISDLYALKPDDSLRWLLVPSLIVRPQAVAAAVHPSRRAHIQLGHAHVLLPSRLTHIRSLFIH